MLDHEVLNLCSILYFCYVITRKLIMKKLIPFLCLVFILSACKKSNVTPYSSMGVITGYDTRMCPQCGGLEITIKNDPTVDPPPSYRINSNASTQFNLGSNPKYPINVTLDWRRDTSIHGGNYIIITRLKVIN